MITDAGFAACNRIRWAQFETQSNAQINRYKRMNQRSKHQRLASLNYSTSVIVLYCRSVVVISEEMNLCELIGP